MVAAMKATATVKDLDPLTESITGVLTVYQSERIRKCYDMYAKQFLICNYNSV